MPDRHQEAGDLITIMLLREEVVHFDYIFYSFGMEHYGNIPLIESQ